MLHPSILLVLAAVLCGAPALAHDISQNGVRIAHPFATPTPPGAPNGAAYLDISAGATDVALTGASSPVGTVEVHSMTLDDGNMRMRRLESLAIPAGDTLRMRPGGGVHLMLIGLEEALEAGGRFPLTLEFAEHGNIEVEVWVQESGAGSEAASGHHH